MTRYSYRLAGIGLTSNTPLDGLERGHEENMRGWRLAVARHPLAGRQARRFRSRLLADGSWQLVWPGEGAYTIHPQRRLISCRIRSTLTQAAFLDTLRGPILSCLLIYEGRTPLHASAVCVDGMAVGFLGQPGAGKSTTAAGFVLAGNRLITEDLLTFTWAHHQPYAQPGYPELRLWPGSGRRLFPDFTRLPRVVPTASKRLVDPRTLPGGIVHTPTPLRALYELRRSAALARPIIRPLAPGEAFVAVLGNLYNTALVSPSILRRQFDDIGRLLARVPVWRLLVPTTLRQPQRVRDVILQHMRSRANGRFHA